MYNEHQKWEPPGRGGHLAHQKQAARAGGGNTEHGIQTAPARDRRLTHRECAPPAGAMR